MSIFHETMRGILEDVQKFLNITLQHEHLSAASISHKESLLMKIHHLRTEYPQLHLKIIPELEKRGPGSPPPYADMQGNPTTEYVYSDSVEEEYEICDAPDNGDQKGRRDTLGFGSGLNSGKELPDVPASELKHVLKAGYLEKKGKDRLGGWLSLSQRRWVALKSDCLLFFNKNTDKRPCSQLLLVGYDTRHILYPTKDGSKKDVACFELVGPGKKTYQFVAVSQKDAKEWTEAIQKAASSLTENALPTTLPSTIPVQTYSDGSQCSSGEGVCSLRSSVREPWALEGKAVADDVYESVEDGILPAGSPVSEQTDVEDDLYQDTDGSVTLSKDQPSEKRQHPFDLYVGLWDCRAEAADELNFKRGDIVKVISKDYDEYHWWVGEISGHVGLVPKQYLMEAYEMDCER